MTLAGVTLIATGGSSVTVAEAGPAGFAGSAAVTVTVCCVVMLAGAV